MTTPVGPVTAIVVAGGSSTRMGRPKPSLPFAGEPLLARIVRILGESSAEIVVASARGASLPPLPAGVRVVDDETPGLGPLAGLVGGLRAAQHDLALVCGGDHPFPGRDLATHLLALARDHELVVPRWDGRLQPLFAVWRRSLLPRLEALVSSRRLGLVAAAGALGPFEVPEEDVARLDPRGLSFFDVDSPADYERALSLLDAG